MKGKTVQTQTQSKQYLIRSDRKGQKVDEKLVEIEMNEGAGQLFKISLFSGATYHYFLILSIIHGFIARLAGFSYFVPCLALILPIENFSIQIAN